MKNFLILLSLILVLSCSKDENSLVQSPDTVQASQRSANVTIEDGIISFRNYADIKVLLDDWFENDNDEYLREQMYLELGLAPSYRSSGLFYTLYPSSALFDERNSFQSLRKEVEEYKISELNRGNEYIYSIVTKPYFKSILNTNGAVRIGNRIYVNYESGLIAVIANNDLEAYNRVISTNPDELSNSFNVRLLHNNNTDEYVSNVRTGSFEDILVKDIHVKEIEDSDGNIRLVNQSMVEFENDFKPEFVWTFSDGSSETGTNPSRVLSPFDTYDVVAEGPPGGGGGGGTFGPVSGPRFCSPGKPWKYYTKLNSNTYRFHYINQDPETNMRWTIKCGDEEPYIRTDGIAFTRTFCACSEVELEICATRPQAPDLYCCETGIIRIMPDQCDKTAESKDKQEVTFDNGETWEIDCLGWVETSGVFDGATPGDVGARTRTKKRNPNGGFSNATPEFGIAGVTGQYADKDEDCTVYDIDLTSINDNDQNSQANHDHDGARLIPNEGCAEPSKIYSRHGLTVGGQTLFYTKNGGKLWIQD